MIHSGQISFISHRTVNLTYIHHINVLSCNNKECFWQNNAFPHKIVDENNSKVDRYRQDKGYVQAWYGQHCAFFFLQIIKFYI